jgi:hypothetical protein
MLLVSPSNLKLDSTEAVRDLDNRSSWMEGVEESMLTSGWWTKNEKPRQSLTPGNTESYSVMERVLYTVWLSSEGCNCNLTCNTAGLGIYLSAGFDPQHHTHTHTHTHNKTKKLTKQTSNLQYWSNHSCIHKTVEYMLWGEEDWLKNQILPLLMMHELKPQAEL